MKQRIPSLDEFINENLGKSFANIGVGKLNSYEDPLPHTVEYLKENMIDAVKLDPSDVAGKHPKVSNFNVFIRLELKEDADSVPWDDKNYRPMLDKHYVARAFPQFDALLLSIDNKPVIACKSWTLRDIIKKIIEPANSEISKKLR